ncbi:MAG: YggS family pyridoxal phosphate-dependent enzyme [Candidatus Omnitrophica bacterium]|nr:YggS family pyridoxal phosphate-dependent enzyme [Candidatus Omnitrophota bacterium]
MLKANLCGIRERIASVCSKINREPESITIVAVCKNRTVEEIREAIAVGITDIGENKVQEAIAKYNKLSAVSCQLSASKWHMVGHLQSNKVKQAVKIFDLIHSVDSLKLAEGINRQAESFAKVQDILLEVNTSGEASKYGLRPQETIGVIKGLAGFKNLNIKGLMTIAPIVDNPEDARPYFKSLRELRDKINNLRLITYDLQLSMGMSDDFEAAIEEGADIVRLGRAIFE